LGRSTSTSGTGTSTVRTGDSGLPLSLKVPLLVAGVLVLWALATSRWFDRLMSRVVERLLARWTELEVHDYAGLLRLGGNYRIAEIAVERGGWLDGRSLSEARTAEEGVLVLGIASPDGEWLGTPRGDTRPGAGDTLVVYGRSEAIESLQQRRTGAGAEREHEQAVDRQAHVAAQERQDREVRERRSAGPGDGGR
jgi:hypothetical protein